MAAHGRRTRSPSPLSKLLLELSNELFLLQDDAILSPDIIQDRVFFVKVSLMVGLRFGRVDFSPSLVIDLSPRLVCSLLWRGCSRGGTLWREGIVSPLDCDAVWTVRDLSLDLLCRGVEGVCS